MTPPRKRGRPPLPPGAALPQAVRSSRAQARREAERAGILQAMAAAIRALTLRRTDTAAGEVIDALGDALAGLALDLHSGPGTASEGADAAIRAAVRSLHAALADLLDDSPEAASGAIRQALDEIDSGMPG